ncbi:hypothetical protein L9F63_004162, partial [Diploptera punctata]
PSLSIYIRLMAYIMSSREAHITGIGLNSFALNGTVFIVLILNLFGLVSTRKACSSRSTPKPRPPSPTARPNITFHTYACPPAYAKWYCLNGATCFTVKIGESLLYNCECAEGYIGQRCEFKDLDGSYLQGRRGVMLETASIAGGATIAVFLVVIVCIAAYIHFQRKQKETRARSLHCQRSLEVRQCISIQPQDNYVCVRVASPVSAACFPSHILLHRLCTYIERKSLKV